MLFFGAADVDLTPPELLPLGGYTERRSAPFVPGGDQLTARIRIVGDVVLVTAEMLTIPESLYASVKAKASVEKLFLVATHTHCAPDSQMLNDRMTFQIPGISPFRRRWLEWYSGQIASGILRARASGSVSILGFVEQRASAPFARSRRRVGGPDNMATRVVARTSSSEHCLFTVFGAHPTLYDSKERQLRGDWPGELMRLSGGLAFTGAIGNASPVPAFGASYPPIENVRGMATGLDSILNRASEVVTGAEAFSFTTERIKFEQATPHPEFAKANSVTEGLAQSVVSQFAPKDSFLTAFRIGDLVVLGVPGEPTGVLSRQIATVGHRFGVRTALVSHANGWAGYLLDREDYGRGGYEAQLSFYGPSAGAKLVDAATVLLRRLSSPKRDTATQKLPL